MNPLYLNKAGGKITTRPQRAEITLSWSDQERPWLDLGFVHALMREGAGLAY